MKTKRFVIPFSISLIAYTVLDFGFSNMMLYIMGGVIGGSVSEIFKSVGLNVGIVTIALIWIMLLMGVVMLFYRIKNMILKYIIAIVVAALLYVVDILVASIPYSETEDPETVVLISNVVIGALILSKSILFSMIVYFDPKRKMPDT